jgi:hypothetical protein
MLNLKIKIMKTIAKTLMATGILLITLNIIAIPDSMGQISSGKIAYVVNVVPPQNRNSNLNLNLVIGITDENGRLVAPVQNANTRVLTYVFYEQGPVIGTRTAHLVNETPMPPNDQFVCPPVSMTGKFNPGSSYLFTLYPRINNIIIIK